MTTTAVETRAVQRDALREAWKVERAAARAARRRADHKLEWHHLERAHILSQPMVGPHVRTHAAMFGTALRRRDAKELVGQLARLVMAAPGSASGRYPLGNTGGADVSPFRPMPVPEEFRTLLGLGEAK